MDTATIVRLLVEERDRLNRAIEALTGSTTAKRRGRPPKKTSAEYSDPTMPEWVKPASAKKKPAKKKRIVTQEQRDAQAARMKKFWAAKKKAAKKTAS
jgi:hypothetical protein